MGSGFLPIIFNKRFAFRLLIMPGFLAEYRSAAAWERFPGRRACAVSGVIAEYGRRMQEEQGKLFDSDRVRWSACIEEAEAEIVEIRRVIAEKYTDWEERLNLLSLFVQFGP